MRNRTRIRYSSPPAERFPLLFETAAGWRCHDRGAYPSHPHLIRLYLVPPSPYVGRFWITWSRNLGRLVRDSQSHRLTKRWPAQLAGLELELLENLERLEHPIHVPPSPTSPGD